MYVIGKTGVGKTTLLKTMILQDMAHGEGLAVIDPHGDLIEDLLLHLPECRKADLVYFNVADAGKPLGFNPLDRVPPESRALAASGILDAFKKIWADSWGPRLEHILRNALLALLDQEDATLGDILRLLDDKTYRKYVLLRVKNRAVYDFWIREYEHYSERFRTEAIAPIQNKVGAFMSNPILNRIFTQPRSAFDLRQVLDSGKILLVNLAKGRIGEDAAALMGAVLVAKLNLAALSRANLPESKRDDFYCYLDEFPMFATEHLAGMLSELRKYRLCLILAHQFLSQLDEPVRDGIIGNSGTLIVFRLGAIDAEIFEKEFYPSVTAEDLTNLPNYNIFLKLMIDGKISHPFSAEVLTTPGTRA